MHGRPGSRSRQTKRRGRIARGFQSFTEDFVGEVIASVVACALFAGASALVAWGFSRAPRSTLTLLIALAALVGCGFWNMRRDRASRGLFATVAVAVAAFVTIWAMYVFSYCTCS